MSTDQHAGGWREGNAGRSWTQCTLDVCSMVANEAAAWPTTPPAHHTHPAPQGALPSLHSEQPHHRNCHHNYHESPSQSHPRRRGPQSRCTVPSPLQPRLWPPAAQRWVASARCRPGHSRGPGHAGAGRPRQPSGSRDSLRRGNGRPERGCKTQWLHGERPATEILQDRDARRPGRGRDILLQGDGRRAGGGYRTWKVVSESPSTFFRGWGMRVYMPTGATGCSHSATSTPQNYFGTCPNAAHRPCLLQ